MAKPASSAGSGLTRALEPMLAVLLLAGSTLAAPAQCPLSSKAQTGLTASAALEEIAEERGVSEYSVGAVLILWREDACEALAQDLELLPETKQALDAERQQVIYLPAGEEKQYIEAARQPIRSRKPSLVSLAWALPGVSGGPLSHVFLVADGASSLRVTSPGYGRKGKVHSTCGASPWALAAVADGL